MMRISGELFLLAVLVIGPTILAAAEPPPKAWADYRTPIDAKDWNYQRAAHLLERAGFGGTPEAVEKLARMTPAQTVDFLVD